MRTIHRAAFIGCLLVSSLAQGQSSLPAGTWRTADAPPELRYQISRADLIVVSMQDAMLRELNDALEQGGPAFAIKSCHIDVVSIIQRIGRQEGVAAGRTSDRLRNPTNAPRAWAESLVKTTAGGRAREVDGFAVDLGDKVGVLRPIAERPMCASCHGPAEKIDPVVRTTLIERYPADRATGFNEGEIRGWFWVEVPKKLR
jgi:hypothetical protein